ncbi:hypothetical protein [Achromobacter aloeverae]|uniref:hypothetical protein n=1 Tax=Achromobacter aloeverae TaxID=1750518 RepID=UPI00130100C3
MPQHVFDGARRRARHGVAEAGLPFQRAAGGQGGFDDLGRMREFAVAGPKAALAKAT